MESELPVGPPNRVQCVLSGILRLKYPCTQPNVTANVTVGIETLSADTPDPSGYAVDAGDPTYI